VDWSQLRPAFQPSHLSTSTFCSRAFSQTLTTDQAAGSRIGLKSNNPRSNIFFGSFSLCWPILNKTQSLIAIVDDEEPIRKALKRLLRSAGLEVETFPSGVEFLESLAIRRPDCVVLDLHMPVMSGFEVQARLAEFDAPVPVVVITGHDSDETRAQALAGQPVAYLRKPVNDQVLLDAIELALSHNPRSQNKKCESNKNHENTKETTIETEPEASGGRIDICRREEN
jgi:FixJ family two-component response regulator